MYDSYSTDKEMLHICIFYYKMEIVKPWRFFCTLKNEIYFSRFDTFFLVMKIIFSNIFNKNTNILFLSNCGDSAAQWPHERRQISLRH